MAHKLEVKSSKLSGVALALLSSGQQAMDRQLQRLLTQGTIAFGLSAEEKANLTGHLEGEVHAELRALSQGSVAKIMHDVSEDLRTDELRDEVLAASRAVLASELGKLAAEAKTLAAEKLEEKIQLAAIGTKLEKKQLDSAVREVLEHAEVSAADALWAAQTVLSESAAINERVKKSSASALMQLRTGQWQAATSKIAAEAPMFMAELVIFQRMSSRLDHFVQALSESLHLDLSEVGPGPAPHVAAVQRAAQETLQQAIAAQSQSPWKEQLAARLKGRVWRLVQNKCRALTGTDMEEVRRQVADAFQSFDLPQDDMVFQLQEDLEHAVEEVALENRQEAEDSYLEALSRQDDSASAHCLGVCLESANDLAEFLGDLSAYALHETHRSLSPAEQRAWKLGRVRAKADHGLLAVVKAAASSAQRHCTENRTGFVQAVKADVRREANRARHSLMLQLEDLVAANKTGVTAKDQQRFMTLVDERLWKPMEEAVLSYRPCGADSTSPRNQAQLLYHGTVRRLLQEEASIKLAAKWSTKMESLNSVLLEEAFWPKAQATLAALEVTGKPKKLPSTKPSERRQKMVTAMGDWAANNQDDLEAYYYKARDSAISNAVELLYGKGALGPPLCKAATTLGENLDQSYAKALEVRNGNMFSTFKEAGDLACKLEWGIDEVVQFITNIYDILQTFKILLKMVSGLPIVGVLAKVLDKPVVYLMKFMDRELIPVRDRLRDNFHPKFELACEFQKTVVTRVGYAIEAIRVLKLQAFPANKAAGLVGEAMNVCAWLPPVALLADGALTSVASLDSLAGASTDLVRDMVSWVETLIPTSALKKMESSNQIMNVILLPVRKTEATLSTVYKVCIPAVKCWKFTLLGLLKALSNFLEKIFNFALKPFQPIVEAAVAPVRRTLEKAFSSLLPPLQIPFPEFSGLFEDEPSLMDLVRNAFRTDTDQTFSGQIEKAMQLTKKQASYCYSYGTELPAAEGICNDISAKYGAVRNPFECQKLCQSACSRCVRWSFVTTDAAVGAGVCRFTRSNAYYEVKSPTSVSGPKTCGDVTKYQPDTFVQHVESRLCKDMGAFPEIKGAEACKKACFVDGDCQVVQMSGGMCYVGAGKKGCSRGPTSMSLHKTRTAKEALQTRCNAATGVQRDCDAWALEEATKEVQGAGSQAVQDEVMELTSTSYQKFTCELLELDVDCPDVNKGDKVDSFDKCKEGAEFVFKESEEEIKKQIDAEVQEQLAACRREAHESLKPLCPVFSWRGIKREKNKKVPPKFKNQYCLLRQKIQASAAYCDYLIKTHGSFGGKTSTTLAAEVRASFVPTESCAKASGDQFLCEMKFLNEGGGETKQMDLTNQIQLQNMYQAKQFDNLAAETQKVKQELAGIQTQMDEGFSKTREQLFSMDKAAANRTEEQTRQIFEKLESSQKEQNARMAYMMQAAQCDSKLQTKELKDFMTSGLNNLQSAVLSGTGQQIDEATSKIKDAVANSQRAVQKQMKESFTDLKDTVTEGFDQVQNKLDANRKAIQKQMTDRFNAVDQKLVHVQGQLDSALKGIETVDNRSLVNSSDCIQPWLVQTHSNRSQDVHAERLLVYGRKSAAATDLQSCEGGAKLVSLSCGDGQITGNEVAAVMRSANLPQGGNGRTAAKPFVATAWFLEKNNATAAKPFVATAWFLEKNNDGGCKREACYPRVHPPVKYASMAVFAAENAEVNCGAVTASFGMGIGWNSPATVREGILSQPGERGYRLQNVPAELIGGKYIGHKTWPSKSGGTWKISYTTPVTLYVWVVKEEHNAGIDAMLSNDGWAFVAAPGFKRSDGPALHVWKRFFATGSTYLIKTKELMVGGVISSQDCEVSCGAVTGSSGMGIGWNSPATVKEGVLSQPGQRAYTLQNVPAELIGGTYVGHKTWPSKSGGTWTISYTAPVTLYVWVIKEKHNAGIDAMLSNDGWAPVAAPGFQRSDGWALHVWKRHFATGSTYLIKTKELMIGGVISKAIPSACKVSCGAVAGSSGMGIPWNSPATVKEGILSQPGQRGYTLQNVPAELIGGTYIGHQAWPSKSGGTWNITYQAPVILYVWVVKEKHNAGIDAMLSNDGWAPVAAPGFQRSDGWTLHVWKRYFGSGSTYLIKTTELMVGGVISSKVSSECKAAATCGAVAGSSGMGIPWNSPATVKEGILSQPGQRDYKLQNVPAELIGGSYTGHQAWPSKSGGTWTISYTTPVTLYVIVLKDLHNAGVDAMLSNDGWAAVEAPGFKRSDGWAFNVWKRYFATGNTYLIKTKELMIGGVISSKVSSQGCEA
ncbi:unnamed protein product [Effrenium voratum]|nr:unnamed protein product [Effrenium voratum]